MDPNDENHSYLLGWCSAYIFVAGMFICAVWFGQFDKLCTASQPAWLPWAQPEEHCFREWLSALSGWFGGGAAVVGAYLVYHQLAENRRQTDYIKGDIPPEIYLDSQIIAKKGKDKEEIDEWVSELRITVINRNRRSLILRTVELLEPEDISLGVRATEIAGKENLKLFGLLLKSPNVHETLAGRDDGQPAPRCAISCHLFEAGKLIKYNPQNPDHDFDRPIRIRLNCVQKDAADKKITLEASGTFIGQ
ncbi:hypothetical protein MOV66_07715 [Agrobacterium sp. SHOUNA12C]|nr:hypothetical protein [Agrobacterium sp. BETTINA12B]MCJ9756527.1 hypothetical protein [Agrobacterium sp. SHOUNA12C]